MVRAQRVGGAAGVAAVACLLGQSFVRDPEGAALLKTVGGLALLWFTAALAARLRRAGPGHHTHAAIALAAGTAWTGVWLLSALFDAMSARLADAHVDPAGARLADVLADETLFVLSPGLTLVLLAATALVVARDRGFPRLFAYATVAAVVLRAVLAVVDWYGTGALSVGLTDLVLVWVVAAAAQLTVRPRIPQETPT